MTLNLSREQCSSIKGYAILLILIHNFFTYALDIKCNESFYAQENTTAFLNNIMSESFLGELFGFIGWIGVPLFFFISGYGLSKKYNNAEVNWFSFLKSHLFKLWKLLIPIFLIYTLVDVFVFDSKFKLIDVFIPQITFITNIIQHGNNGFYWNPGAYWFFGAILQFYFIYLILRKLNVKQLTILFFVFLLIQYGLQYCFNEEVIRWANHNFIGWGAPFTLGMILAKRHDTTISQRMNIAIIVASIALLCASLLTKIFSPLAQIAIVLLFIGLVQFKLIKSSIFLGIISASIFVIHPLVRLFIINLSDVKNNLLVTSLCYIIITIVISWVHHKIMTRQKILTRK